MDLEQFFKDVDVIDENKFVGFKDVGSKDCCVGENFGVSELCVGIEEEEELIRKRKKECYLPLLDWVKRVAKNPCDPAVGSMPSSSKWKAYGSDHVWRQVLSAKEALRVKVNDHSNTKQSVWQKKRKMHPDMYDLTKSTPRCSQRLVTVKETRSILLSRKLQVRDCSESTSNGSLSDVEDEDFLWATKYRRKRIPVGHSFQAETPHWPGEKIYESETKWLGTCVWPLEETEKRSSLIEREPIGAGRQGSCGCEFIGSSECVRFHIAEKRSRVKIELGSAFTKWKIDTMGEIVSLEWTKNEEKKFADIIKSNPESSGRSFWDELVTYFKNKTRTALVSYYFNVYLVRRRAYQNRADPSNVDSDDDELEKVGHDLNKSTEYILCSPKKVHLNST